MTSLNFTSYFSKQSRYAFQNEPPGEWMPQIPNNCIRLSSGYPAPSLVPVRAIEEAVNHLLQTEQDLPLHYLGTPKMDQLKSQIVNHLNSREMDVKED